MATPDQDQIKVLEQTRQRLVRLTRSLGSLVASLNQGDPLPAWTSLQSQAMIISNNLLSVSEQLSEHEELFSSLVAYPGPTYPGRTQANALEQLLRTKLDPRIEDWVNRGRVFGATPASTSAEGPAAAAGTTTATLASSFLGEVELEELWEWAPIEANREARRRDWGGDFTLEEQKMGIQNVVTGLKRPLMSPEDDADDEEEEVDEEEEEGQGEAGGDGAMTGIEMNNAALKPVEGPAGLGFDLLPPPTTQLQGLAKPAMPLDHVLRYMMTGQLSNQR